MAERARTALVTGGTGFVGSHTVDAFLAAGYRVRCTVRRRSRLRWLEGKPVEQVEVDLRGGDLGAAVSGAEVVVHCAGLTRGSRAMLLEVNRDGTRALVAACADAGASPRFIYCSSQAAAGPGAATRPRRLDDPPAPVSDYGRSKLAAEEEVRRYADRLEVSVLRPVAVYGPRDEDTLPFFRLAARGAVVAPGWRSRYLQLVHAGDVARALLRAAERPEAVGNAYFVGHPEVISWTRLAEAMGRAVGRRVLALRIPSAAIWLAGAASQLIGGDRAGWLDLRRAFDLTQGAWTCEVEPTVEELGWQPEYDLERGLLDAATWYEQEGWL